MSKKKKISENTDRFGVPQILIEMARIGDAGPYSFWVYTEPLNNPSFHFKHKTDFEVVLQMKDLKILEIKHNNSKFPFKKGDQLPGVIHKLVQAFLKDKNKKLPHRSNEQAIDDAWKLLNE